MYNYDCYNSSLKTFESLQCIHWENYDNIMYFFSSTLNIVIILTLSYWILKQLWHIIKPFFLDW